MASQKLLACTAGELREAQPQNYKTDVGTLWGVGWLNVLPRDFGFPSIKIAGFSQIGDADQLPLRRTTGVWQLHEGISCLRGAHSLRAGGEYRRIGADGISDDVHLVPAGDQFLRAVIGAKWRSARRVERLGDDLQSDHLAVP